MGTLRLQDLAFLAQMQGAAAPSFLLLETGAGDYVLQEGTTDKIIIDSTSSSGGNKPILNLPAVSSLAVGDLLIISHDPLGSVVSQKLTVQSFFNAIDALGAAGALTLSDLIPLFTGGAATAATIQTILNAVTSLTAQVTSLAETDKLLVTQGGIAKSTTLKNASISAPVLNPDFKTWIIRQAWAWGNSTLAGASPGGDAWTAVVSGTGSVAVHDPPTALQPVGKKMTAGPAAGRYGAWNGNLIVCFNHAITVQVITRVLATADFRFHTGLYSGGYADFDDQDDVSFGEWCGFRFSTNVPDTYLMFGSGTGGVLNAWHSTGVIPDANTVYLLEFRLRDDGTVDAYVNRTRTNSSVAVTISASTPMRVVTGMTSLAAATKAFTLFETRAMQRFLY